MFSKQAIEEHIELLIKGRRKREQTTGIKCLSIFAGWDWKLPSLKSKYSMVNSTLINILNQKDIVLIHTLFLEKKAPIVFQIRFSKTSGY